LAASKRKERHGPAIQVEAGCLGFWARVAIAPHKLVNPPWRDASGFEPKRKTCPAIQVEGGCWGSLASVAIAPHKFVNPSCRDAGLRTETKDMPKLRRLDVTSSPCEPQSCPDFRMLCRVAGRRF